MDAPQPSTSEPPSASQAAGPNASPQDAEAAQDRPATQGGGAAPTRSEAALSTAARLLLAWLLASFLLTVVYVGHAYDRAWLSDEGPIVLVKESTIIFGEAGIVLLLPWAIGTLIARRMPRLGWGVGAALLLLTTLAAVGDILTHVTLRQPLLSGMTLGTLWRAAPLISVGLTARSVLTPLVATAAVAVIVVAIPMLGARWLPYRRYATTAALAIGAVCFLRVAENDWDSNGRLLLGVQNQPTRHPLAVLLWTPKEQPTVAFTREQRVRLGAASVREKMTEADFRQRYETLALPADWRPSASPGGVLLRPEKSLPDIVIVFGESIRGDVITPESMPILHRQVEHSLVLDNHYSAGNGTTYSYHGMISGLDGRYWEAAQHWSPALPRLLKQAGYQVGMVGSTMPLVPLRRGSDFQGHDFLITAKPANNVAANEEGHARVFEYFNVLDGDEIAASITDRILRRDPEVFAPDAPANLQFELRGTLRDDRPTCIVLYNLTTHFPYYFPKGDPYCDHFQPSKASVPFPYGPADAKAVFNRYRNSIRHFDREIAALVTPKPGRETLDHYVVVMGDHGDEFQEAGHIMHGTAMTPYQAKTMCWMLGPNITGGRRTGRTMHGDILPTLLDAIGVPIEGLSLLNGRSVLRDEPPADRTICLADFSTRAPCLIGPWSERPGGVFGFRSDVQVPKWPDWTVPIGHHGRPVEATEQDVLSLVEATVRYRRHAAESNRPSSDRETFEAAFDHAAADVRELAVRTLAEMPTFAATFRDRLATLSTAADEPLDVRLAAAEALDTIDKANQPLREPVSAK